MKYRKGKNLIITVICAMLVLLISFSCVTIVSSGKISEKEDQPQAAGTYTFGSESIDNDSDEYTENTTFYIDSIAGLKAFSISVSWGADGEPCDFSGKIVKLKRDLTPDSLPPIGCHWTWRQDNNGKNILSKLTTSEQKFKGTFDGQGHKLKVVVNTENIYSEDDIYAFGLFSQTDGATIKNLELEFSMRIEYIVNSKYEDINSKNFYFGGVVGRANNTTIYNCIVDYNIDFEILSLANKYYGGIVGYLSNSKSSKGIYDCYVKNFSTTIGELVPITTQTVKTYMSGLACKDSVSSVRWCVIDNGDLIEYNGYNTRYKNWSILKGGIEGVDYSKYEYNFYTLTSNGDNRKALYCTAQSWTRNDFLFSNQNSDTWYTPPTDQGGFNSGIPYPRGAVIHKKSQYQFLDIKTYEFIAGENGTVTLIGKKYSEPENNTLMVARKHGSSLPTPQNIQSFNFEGVIVQANGEDGYEFKEWKTSTRVDSYGNTIYVFTAEFSMQHYIIKFLPHAESSIQEIAEFTLTIDDSLNIESGYLEGQTYISVNNQIIQYVPGKYYLLRIETDYDNYNLVIGNNNLIDFGDSGTIVNVTFVLELKSYEIDIS